MAVLNGHTTMPHHRQNRRRERPGSRARRTISRKASLQQDFADGIQDAYDPCVPLPSDKARPSPLLRQNFEQCWQRFKMRQAEELALVEMDNMQSESGQLSSCGADSDDDELFRMGMLYDEEKAAHDLESNTVSCYGLIERTAPMFVFRQGKPRSARRRTTLQPLSLQLSFAGLSDDVDIAQLLSSPFPHTSTIQHRITIRSPPADINMSPSLPLAPALEFSPNSLTALANNTISLPSDTYFGDWTLIPTAHTAANLSTPHSEPETWVLIDD